jgi:hypothetical protein
MFLRKDNGSIEMPQIGKLTTETVLAKAQTPVTSELGVESIILDPASGIYYGLNNDVGTRIWQLLSNPIPLSEIFNVIASEYSVEMEECRSDVMNLVQQLIDHNLVEIHHESAV